MRGVKSIASANGSYRLVIIGLSRYVLMTFGIKKIPTINSDKTAGAITIPNGSFNGGRSYFSGSYLPKNVWKMIIMQYTNVKMLAIQATTGNKALIASDENMFHS